MAPRILIVKLSSMGDVLHTLPAAQALRADFPDAHLGWAVEHTHAALLRRQPWLDDLIEWRRGGWRGFADFVRRLRTTRWDVAVDFQGLLRSALVARLSCARRIAGFAPAKEQAHWLYHDRVPLATIDRHAVERSLDLARAVASHLGQAVDKSLSLTPTFPLQISAAERDAVSTWLARLGSAAGDRLVLLNPHCRKPANIWPAERFAQLADRLYALPGIRVALVGGAASREACDEVAKHCRTRPWRADGQFDLLGSAELIRRAAVFVTGDTGPMHIAAAVGTPIVALFGPANPVRTGPYASNATIIQHSLPCSPCYARNRCPLGHAVPACMAEISVNKVLERVLSLLDAHAMRRSA